MDNGNNNGVAIGHNSTSNITNGFVLTRNNGTNVGVGTTTPKAAFHNTGGYISKFITINNYIEHNYAATIDDYAIFVNTGTDDPSLIVTTIILPNSPPNGQIFSITNYGTGVVNVISPNTRFYSGLTPVSINYTISNDGATVGFVYNGNGNANEGYHAINYVM